MKYGCLLAAVAGLSFQACLVACGGETSNSANCETDGFETVVRDSVVIRDSVVVRDSVVIRDSVVLRDSVRLIDSLRIMDSVYVKDSIRVKDSVHVKDSIRIIDSVEIADTSVDRRSLIARYVEQSAVKEFVPLESVLGNLAEDEKVIVLLPHAERGDDYSSTGPLNDNGKEQSEALGKKLVGDLDIYYAASHATRTLQTCTYIAKARGEKNAVVDTIELLGGYWFVKDTVVYNKAKKDHDGSWNVTTKWLYEGSYADAFYDVAPRSAEYLDSIIFPAMEKSGKRVGLFISHDLVLLPIVVYVSDRNIDMKYYKSSSKRWLNYLAGLAIVLKPDGTLVFYAVKGLDSGTMKN